MKRGRHHKRVPGWAEKFPGEISELASASGKFSGRPRSEAAALVAEEWNHMMHGQGKPRATVLRIVRATGELQSAS